MENKQIAETKTAEEMLSQSLGRTYRFMPAATSIIVESMEAYADQEKRATAIGFWKWAMEKYISHTPMGFWDGKVPSDEKGISWISPETAYDLYLTHLQSQLPKQ